VKPNAKPNKGPVGGADPPAPKRASKWERVEANVRRNTATKQYEVRVFAGRDPGGKVHHLSSTAPTLKEARLERARLQIEAERLGTGWLAARSWGSGTTVNEALDDLRVGKWSELKPKTILGYESVSRKYLRGSIGKMRVSELNPLMIEQFLRSLKDDGVGQDNLRQVMSLLSVACAHAVKGSQGKLVNPCLGVELPKYPARPPESLRDSPTPDELRAILHTAALEDPEFFPFLRTAAATGMRRGELLGLQWADVDFERLVISIRRNVTVGPAGVVVTDPKTPSSQRDVTIDLRTAAILGDRLDERVRVLGELHLTLEPASFVFAWSPEGRTPPDPDNVSRKARQVINRAIDDPVRAKQIDLHSFRYFAPTQVDSIATSNQLDIRHGWTEPRTRRGYQKRSQVADAEIADAIGALLDAGE